MRGSPWITLDEVEYCDYPSRHERLAEYVHSETIHNCDPRVHTEHIRTAFVDIHRLARACRTLVSRKKMATVFADRCCEKGEVPSKGSRNGVSDLCFRVSNKQIVPYFKVSFPTTAMSEICFRPRIVRETQEALEWFLTQNGYDIGRVKIREAAATYR